MIIPRFSRGGAAGVILRGAFSEKYPKLWEQIRAEIDDHRKPTIDYWLPESAINFDKVKFEKAIHGAKTARAGTIITVFDVQLSTLMRYLYSTIPNFSMSAAMAKVLEYDLSARYPKLWEKLQKLQ